VVFFVLFSLRARWSSACSRLWAGTRPCSSEKCPSQPVRFRPPPSLTHANMRTCAHGACREQSKRGPLASAICELKACAVGGCARGWRGPELDARTRGRMLTRPHCLCGSCGQLWAPCPPSQMRRQVLVLVTACLRLFAFFLVLCLPLPLRGSRLRRPSLRAHAHSRAGERRGKAGGKTGSSGNPRR